MAAITPDAVDPTAVLNGVRSGDTFPGLQGLRRLTFPFITQAIDSGDTFTLDGSLSTSEVQIVRAAWESAAGDTETVALTITGSGDNLDTVGFTAGGDDFNGYLHVWVAA